MRADPRGERLFKEGGLGVGLQSGAHERRGCTTRRDGSWLCTPPSLFMGWICAPSLCVPSLLVGSVLHSDRSQREGKSIHVTDSHFTYWHLVTDLFCFFVAPMYMYLENLDLTLGLHSSATQDNFLHLPSLFLFLRSN